MQAGDTLAGIAAALWGDASLWYKIAEVNGLTAESQLIEGMPLLIPVGVVRTSNTAETFKPYDPPGASGDSASGVCHLYEFGIADLAGLTGRKATRDRVLGNIAESRAARESSRFGRYVDRESQVLGTTLVPEGYYATGVRIDMRAAPAGSASNAAGFPRNGPWFWRQVLKNRPELFDTMNAGRIRSGQAPIVNDTWVRWNPQHEAFFGNRLVHHHIGQGPVATAVPENVHRTWSSALHTN